MHECPNSVSISPSESKRKRRKVASIWESISDALQDEKFPNSTTLWLQVLTIILNKYMNRIGNEVVIDLVDILCATLDRLLILSAHFLEPKMKRKSKLGV